MCLSKFIYQTSFTMRGLPKEQVEEIRKIYSTTKRTMKDIGEQYGVTATSVMRFCKDLKVDNKNRGTGKKEQYNKWTKLSRYKVKKIIATYLKGNISQKKLAEQFNVHQTTVCNIVKGKSWKHLYQNSPYKKEELRLKFNGFGKAEKGEQKNEF